MRLLLYQPPHLIEALLDGGLEERLNLLDELLNTEEEYVKVRAACWILTFPFISGMSHNHRT